MLLSDRDLRTELAAGRLRVTPLGPKAIQPASIDLHLGAQFQVFTRRDMVIDPARRQELTELFESQAGEPFILQPGEFVLGCTFEQVAFPDDLGGRLEGVSSRGRLGLQVHSTAGFIDPGFAGCITLELSNIAPLPTLLTPGERIGQLCLYRLSSPAEHPYGSGQAGSRYQGQSGPTPSRAWMDGERDLTGHPVCNALQSG